MHIRSLAKATQLKGDLERAQQSLAALDKAGTTIQLHIVEANGKTVSVVTTTGALAENVRRDIERTVEEKKQELLGLGLDFD